MKLNVRLVVFSSVTEQCDEGAMPNVSDINFPMAGFKRKLTALSYPCPDKFDLSNQTQYRGLVVWLEDQKIRHYRIDERGELRDVSSESWPSALHKYLSDLACPLMSGSSGEILDWLLGTAVRFEYGEKVGTYNKCTGEWARQARYKVVVLARVNMFVVDLTSLKLFQPIH